jgi:hypothetical protein
MSEHGNLLIGECAFHAIIVVAQVVIFLLLVFIIVEDFVLVGLNLLCSMPLVMRRYEIGCEVVNAGPAKMSIVKRLELCLPSCEKTSPSMTKTDTYLADFRRLARRAGHGFRLSFYGNDVNA